MTYKDKYFSILGDSVSTLDCFSEPQGAAFYVGGAKENAGVYWPEDTWWGKVIAALGGKLLVNNSFSGSTVIRHPSYEIESYGCSDARTAALSKDGILPDVIFVYLGTNDWGMCARVNENEGVAGDLAIFKVAYKVMLEKLKKNYPAAEIICITPSVSTRSSNPYFQFPYAYKGRHIAEYCDAICAVAAEYGCPAIDLVKDSEPYDTIDDWHPNAEGMQTLAEKILRGMKN